MDAATTLQYRLATAEAELRTLRALDAPRVTSPNDAGSLFRELVKDHEKEHFLCAHFDSRQRPIDVRLVALGSLSEVTVHPREIYRDAVRMAAHSIIIAHNHPSGDTTPSPADKAITKRIFEAGELLGIPLLDHIVFTRTGSMSFAADGLL